MAPESGTRACRDMRSRPVTPVDATGGVTNRWLRIAERELAAREVKHARDTSGRHSRDDKLVAPDRGANWWLRIAEPVHAALRLGVACAACCALPRGCSRHRRAALAAAVRSPFGRARMGATRAGGWLPCDEQGAKAAVRRSARKAPGVSLPRSLGGNSFHAERRVVHFLFAQATHARHISHIHKII